MDELFIALHETALGARGGITGLAKRTGKRQQSLINKLNPADDTHQPTVGEFVAILMDTGDLQPLDVLCQMMGGRLVTRTQGQHASVMGAVLHATREHGDVARAVEDALEDGRIDDLERNRILREVSEARDALATLENTLLRRSA